MTFRSYNESADIAFANTSFEDDGWVYEVRSTGFPDLFIVAVIDDEGHDMGTI